jgi:hypothetical protein
MGDQKRMHEGQGKMQRGARQEMQGSYGRSMGKGGEVGESLRRCIKILNRTSKGEEVQKEDRRIF